MTTTDRVLPDRDLGDLTSYYPAGWNRGAVAHGETANGTACVLWRDREGAVSAALLAQNDTGVPMRVFETPHGMWAYKPAAVHEAIATGQAPTPLSADETIGGAA